MNERLPGICTFSHENQDNPQFYDINIRHLVGQIYVHVLSQPQVVD